MSFEQHQIVGIKTETKNGFEILMAEIEYNYEDQTFFIEVFSPRVMPCVYKSSIILDEINRYRYSWGPNLEKR